MISNIAEQMDKNIKLKATKEKSLQRFHPWIFSGAIKTTSPGLKDGDVVTVLKNKERILGKAHYTKGSIAGRMLAFDFVEIDQSFWDNRITAAYELRKNMGLINNPETNIFRLVNDIILIKFS